MPEPLLVHFHGVELAAESGGRTVAGLAVPFGATSSPTLFQGVARRHRFELGAFDRTIRERGGKVRLFTQHDTDRLPIGRPTSLAEGPDGVRVAFEVANTTAGNDALELVRAGLVGGFSVGVSPIRFRDVDGVIVHTETRLNEVSLVSEPAFEGAVASAFASDSSARLLRVDHAKLLLSLLEKDFR